MRLGSLFAVILLLFGAVVYADDYYQSEMFPPEKNLRFIPIQAPFGGKLEIDAFIGKHEETPGNYLVFYKLLRDGKPFGIHDMRVFKLDTGFWIVEGKGIPGRVLVPTKPLPAPIPSEKEIRIPGAIKKQPSLNQVTPKSSE